MHTAVLAENGEGLVRGQGRRLVGFSQIQLPHQYQAKTELTRLAAVLALTPAFALPADSDNEWKSPGDGDGELS